MALKIEHDYNKFKVTFVGQRFSISVKANDIKKVVSHYYMLDDHVSGDCPVCEKIRPSE